MIEFKNINKQQLIYILISIVIIYFFYNFITSILKYPLIILLGIYIGNLVYIKNS